MVGFHGKISTIQETWDGAVEINRSTLATDETKGLCVWLGHFQNHFSLVLLDEPHARILP